MKRFLIIIGLILAVIIVGYSVGPSNHFDPIKDEPVSLDPDLVKLEQAIASSEKAAHLKPDNEARIVWADSNRKQKTPYSLVYIHGFTASWAEGDPVHKQLAKKFGCNLYLSRMHGHGVDSPDALKDLTPAKYVASAERALAIGRALGDNVILIGTSAGGMLSLYLAAHHPDITGLVLYSPCIAVANPALKLVTKPWGTQILDQVFGGKHVVNTYQQKGRNQYWFTSYHTNGLLALQTMLDEHMTEEVFQKVKQPVFVGYYYKDDDHQDKVVSVPAMLSMYEQLGTPADKKQQVAFPESGEHVISSRFTSHDLTGVYNATEKFIEEVLDVKPVPAVTATLALNPKK